MGELNKRGALWVKKSKRGTDFMSGELETPDGEKIKILVFKNNDKKNEKQPDYTISAEY